MPSRPLVLLAVLSLSCGSTVVADAGADLLPSELDAGPSDAGSLDVVSPDAGSPDAGRPTRPYVPVTCTASGSCSTRAADVCAVLVDLRIDERFSVTFDTHGSNWGGNQWRATCQRGVPLSVSQYSANKDKGTAITMNYDGECSVWSRSWYDGDSTENETVASTIRALSYE